MNKNNLLVITTYPPKNSIHGNRYSAVASYAKNTLDAIKLNDTSINYLVIADILEKKEEYDENGDQIHRVWQRNSLNLFVAILRVIIRHPSYKKILFEFEFGMFGGSKLLILLLPIFLFILKILGKQIYLVSHGVILTADEVSVQLGLDTSLVKRKIFNIGLKILYSLIMMISDKTIVFEQYLKDRVVKTLGINANKIVVIPHGVESHRQKIDKSEARKELGISQNEFIVMSFGFLIWYKGSDWLIKTFNKLKNQNKLPANAKLIMAGGFSATHKADPIYQKYIEETKNEIAESNCSVIFTDFLPEQKIDLYFCVADLVVLPHRVLISASGPFSFVISHEKPFILSKALAGYEANTDFGMAMQKLNIDQSEVFFDQKDSEDIAKLINQYIKNPEALKKLHDLSKALMQTRNWQSIGQKYYEVIFD